MFDFGWVELAVVVATAGLAALIALRLLVAPRPTAVTPTPTDDPVVFVVDTQAIQSTSPAADALLDFTGGEEGWPALLAIFDQRFPGLPPTLDDLEHQTTLTFSTRDPGADPARLDLTGGPTALTVALRDPRRCAALRHQSSLVGASQSAVDGAANHAPYPIWIIGQDQRLIWGNQAYHETARRHLGQAAKSEVLFDPRDLPMDSTTQSIRCAIGGGDPAKQLWFDIKRVTEDSQTTFFAADVTAVVRAEAAQRNFVQTLTKTFAHLSIGLAIFDRNRQLALFNPALIDLTDLSPEFLSQRPNLMSFFDRLRENQVMPEPKNYTGWRETLADVVIAASDGRYSETWNLPSGLTYRVTGRPHPDGAIAFLFEDISAEISLTRRFREELEIGHTVLDTLDTALAVFSPSGRLTFSNAAYDALWNVEADSMLTDVSAQSATALWQARCHPTPVWADIRDYIVAFGTRDPWTQPIRHLDGTSLTCTVEPLSGGGTLVRFSTEVATQPAIEIAVEA